MPDKFIRLTFLILFYILIAKSSNLLPVSSISIKLGNNAGGKAFFRAGSAADDS